MSTSQLKNKKYVPGQRIVALPSIPNGDTRALSSGIGPIQGVCDLVGDPTWGKLPACQNARVSINYSASISHSASWKLTPRLNQQAPRFGSIAPQLLASFVRGIRDSRSLKRQRDIDRGPSEQRFAKADKTTVRSDDSLAYRQSQPCTIRLRGVERLEHPVTTLGRNSGAIVAHDNREGRGGV